MFQPDALIRAVDFIENNLKFPINVGDIANAAGYSLYHFCRTFSQNLQISPYDYLIRRRLSEALEDVLHSNKKFLEIALDFQFETAEGFSRAIKRLFGENPTEIRKKRTYPLTRKLKPLSAELIQHIIQQQGFTAEKVNFPEQQLFGLMTIVKDGITNSLDILDNFPASMKAKKDVYCIWSDPYLTDQQFLVAGFKGKSADYPTNFIQKTIPASRYTSFHHHGSINSLNLSLRWILNVWGGKQPVHSVIPCLLLKFSTAEDFIQILIPAF